MYIMYYTICNSFSTRVESYEVDISVNQVKSFLLKEWSVVERKSDLPESDKVPIR